MRLSLRFKWLLWIGVPMFCGALVYVFVPKPELYAYQSYSTAVFDKHNQLLRISLAQDDRYRLYTPLSEVAEHVTLATILYEDQNFYQHSGVDYKALVRAFWQTYVLQQRRIGASTIDMQVARLRFGIPSNTLSGKLQQIFRALQLSRHYSKQELLQAYLNLAPYGGNIEGIGAASLIYFNKPASALSMAEALTLAVVPQNPSKRNPASTSGKQQIETAKARLIERWREYYPLHDDMLRLAQLPLNVRKTTDLPYLAPHFVQYLLSQQPRATYSQASDLADWAPAQYLHSTIDLPLQQRLEKVLQAYIIQNNRRGFKNASALLVNHKTMHIEAMIGSANFNDIAIQGQVNGTLAQRSPGSTLKPFVYALALDAGLIHPMTMLKDLPKKYSGFAPENFGNGFVGPISAEDALVKSRNVPAVDLQYQLIEKQHAVGNSQTGQTFYDFLHNAGIANLQAPDFYGLALALGGGEVSMLELVELYATIANLGEHKKVVSTYSQLPKQAQNSTVLLSPESAFLVFDMLQKNPAPGGLDFSVATPSLTQRTKVAWKTGTSWAFRDAWALAISGDYVMAVWIGNFEGPGNNAFIGRSAAGPLLFQLLALVNQANAPSQRNLPNLSLATQFQNTPFDIERLQNLNLSWVDICQSTGDLYEPSCPNKSRTLFIPGVSPIKRTNIYRTVWIDDITGLQRCTPSTKGASEKVFAFWPSDFQALFVQAGIYIEKPPKFEPNCNINEITVKGSAPVINSPQANISYVVQDSVSNSVDIVLQASADAQASHLHWFANGKFIDTQNLESTNPRSPLVWQASPGRYVMQVSDDAGRSAEVTVTVLVVN